MAEPTGWHLDKRVPLGIIGGLVVQTIIVVWMVANFMAVTDARLTHLEQSQTAGAGFDGRIVRLETQYTGLQRSIDAIDAKLDRLLQAIRSGTP